ncbi:MAG: 30S ribosomal protein S2, partial [Candidatus Limnocylindrus sp.]
MAPVTMRDLLEVGAHFGHQTRRWNPKMAPYIYAQRNGIHILDLAKSAKHLQIALDAVRDASANGETVLFVGTKKQAQAPIQEEATRAGQPYVIKRWLGGMLTSFKLLHEGQALTNGREVGEHATEPA